MELNDEDAKSMGNEHSDYEYGYHKGTALALEYATLPAGLNLESDFDFGIMDGIEQSYHDQERERMMELEAIEYPPEFELDR